MGRRVHPSPRGFRRASVSRHGRSRGQDLAYLAHMPPDQARARRFVHEALIAEIEVRQMVVASRRERRAVRARPQGNLLQPKAITALPAVKPRGGGGFIEI